MSKPPLFTECSVCGREFGSKSISIHEPICLQKLRQTVIKDSDTDQSYKGKEKKRRKKTSQGDSSSIGTSNKKISLPKIHNNYLIYPRTSIERPATATLDRPKILNPDYKHYDMSLTRIDFAAASPTLPGTDDNQNRSLPIDTFINRSPFILPAMNPPTTKAGIAGATSPTSRVSQHKVYRSDAYVGGPAKLSAGILHATNVTDALLGKPFKQNSTSHFLGQDLVHEPLFSRQTGNQVSPSRDSPDSGDIPSFPSDFSLHASPIEIRDSLELEQNPELVHRTLHQPHEDEFLTPSTSTTKIPTDEAERKSSVAIESDLYPKLDESENNARISGAAGCASSSGNVQEKSKNAELTNSVAVIYFKITKSEKEDPCESGSETSLCDDEKVACLEPEQAPVNQLIQIIDENSCRMQEIEAKGEGMPSSDNESRIGEAAQEVVGGGLTAVFQNIVGFFCKSTEGSKSKILTTDESVKSLGVGDNTAEIQQRSVKSENSNLLSKSESLEKPKSGHKSITFCIDSNIYHDPPPNSFETPLLEVMEEILQEKSDSDKSKSTTNLMECGTGSETDDENSSTTTPTEILSTPDQKESNCIDVNCVVSSCTLLRRKSMSISFSKKTSEEVPTPSSSEVNSQSEHEATPTPALDENTPKEIALVIKSPSVATKVGSIITEEVERSGSDSMKPAVDNIKEHIKAKYAQVESLNIETSQINSQLNQILKNQSPSEFLGGSSKFLKFEKNNLGTRIRGRKSINTKKTGINCRDPQDEVTIWEGSRMDSDDDENAFDFNLVNNQPRPFENSQQIIVNQNLTNLVTQEVSSFQATAERVLSQASLSNKKPQETGKNKKKVLGDKDLLDQLVGSLVRLHDLHSQNKVQNHFDVQYSAALTNALVTANKYVVNRPWTTPKAKDIPQPYENVPPSVFSPWPKLKLERPKTARASSAMSGSGSKFDWNKEQLREEDAQAPTQQSSEKSLSQLLPPFYINPMTDDNLHIKLKKKVKTIQKKPKATPKKPKLDEGPPQGFRPSTAERLSTPPLRWYLANNNYGCNCCSRPHTPGNSCLYSAKSATTKQPRSCKSAIGTTQTPKAEERLLTPTQVRRERAGLNSANPYLEKPSSKLTSSNRPLFPLIPKLKREAAETQTKTSLKVKLKKEKVKMFVPFPKQYAAPTNSQVFPSVERTLNEIVEANAEESLQSSLGTRRVSAQVRFLEAQEQEDLRNVKSDESNIVSFDEDGQSPSFPIDPITMPELSTEDYEHYAQLDDKPSSQERLHNSTKSKDKIRLKKVKVISTKEGDQVALSYKRKPNSGIKEDGEEMSKGFMAFRDIAMIVPTTPPSKKDFIDLNIVVRRIKQDGTKPELEEIVSEINTDNFYIIIDEVDVSFKTPNQDRSQEMLDVNANETPEESPVEQLVPFLISVSSPVESYSLGFELRHFGKIPVENLKNIVENCAIPTYQAEKLKQISPTSSEFEIEMENMNVISREAILSRSRSSTSTLTRTADMDTWGLSCLTTNEVLEPNDQIQNEGELLYDEEAEKFEKILAQLL